MRSQTIGRSGDQTISDQTISDQAIIDDITHEGRGGWLVHIRNTPQLVIHKLQSERGVDYPILTKNKYSFGRLELYPTMTTQDVLDKFKCKCK